MEYFKKYESYINELFGWFGNDKIKVDKEEIKNMKPIKFGDSGEHIKLLQTALEKLGFKLSRFGIDGKFGSETLGQTKSILHLIETEHNLNKLIDYDNLKIENNTISPEIQSIIIQLSQNDKAQNAIETHYNKLQTNISSTELIGKELISKNMVDPEGFINKVYEISKKLQINPNWLILVMWKESKLNHKIQNKIGATGLIQFMSNTAKGLGTTTEQLKNMSAIEQLDYVYKYFAPYSGKIKSVEDLYMITFFPAALGKDDDSILQTKKLSAEIIAQQNPAININKDDKITVGEFKDYVKKDIPSQWKDEVNKTV